jgi:signal transduction histidine kinase/CheY-like chemotaxis protein
MHPIKPNLSIRATIFSVLSIMNLLIAAQVAGNVYQAWTNHRFAEAVRRCSDTTNDLYQVQNALSAERGTSMAILYSPRNAMQGMRNDLTASRQIADDSLDHAFRRMKADRSSDMSGPGAVVENDYARLRSIRLKLDAALNQVRPARVAIQPDALFDATTTTINDLETLIEDYSLPYQQANAAVARQMRYIHIIWTITEYSGREYAVLGEAIADNRPLTNTERQNLLLWQGRVQLSWELAQTGIINNLWLVPVKPVMADAKIRYALVFEQLKNIFNQPARPEGHQSYPISARLYLQLTSQATDSLQTMGDAVLKVSRDYVTGLNADAKRDIFLSLLWFACVFLLTAYSWRVLIARVLRPVDEMVNRLYDATKGKGRSLQSDRDEIAKLASVLEVFEENARQLVEERDKARAANIAKSEFLANMSHEIRTPMNVVLGLANILGRTQPLTERQMEFIRTLQLSAESLLSLINDLLDFAKIETRSFVIETIPFSLTTLIEDVVTIMSVKAKEKGLVFRTDIAAVTGREFLGDPTRLRQILINLCGNAVKFTETGEIVLSVASAPGEAAGFESIAITVADTGIGIPPEKLGLIFDKFTQADSSINRKYGGTGLGLAIAQAFAEMMGGSIAVQSIYGSGAAFTFTLPLAVHTTNLGAPNALIGKGAAPPARPQGVCVLLVEDHRPNVLVAETYLEQFGFGCDVAESGAEAIEKVRANPYHAVLMDVQMHGLDGYQTTAAIRAWERQNGRMPVRIIGMTAHALLGDREKCLEAGMDDYLSKPFDPEDLRQKLSA